MHRIGPNDKRPAIGRMPPDATWIRDQIEVIGLNPETGETASYVFRAFSFKYREDLFWAVEIWADWAIDAVDRPKAMATMIVPQRLGDLDKVIAESIASTKELCRQSNPNAATLN